MPGGASTSRISWWWRRKATSFAQALDWTAEVYRAAGAMMREAGRLQGVADEGGYWPAFDSNEAALDALVGAIERAGFTPGDEVAISLDIAASEFYRDGAYRLALEERALDSDAMASHVDRLARPLSDRLHRGPAGRARRGRPYPLSPRRPATACRSSATISWSPMRPGCAARPRCRPATPSWSSRTRSAR